MAEDYSRLERRLNGFNIFARETRRNIIDTDAKKSFVEICKLVGERWKALNNETKSVYNQRAKAHNERAKQIKQARQLMSLGEGPVVRQKKKRSNKTPKPRSISGYLVFAHELGREIMSNNPNKQFCDITTIVASQWSIMTSEMKRKYHERAYIYNKRAKEKKSEPVDEESLPSMKESAPAKQVVTLALRPKKEPPQVDYNGKYWTKDDNCQLIDEPERPGRRWDEGESTGFMIYSREIRKVVVNRNRKKDSDTIDKIIVRRWKKLPVTEKLGYHQRALRYNNHIGEHSEQKQIEPKKVAPPIRKKVVKKAAAKPDDKIKRKRGRPRKVRQPTPAARHMSGFIVYSAEVRQQFKDSNPGRGFGYISKLIGAHWKALPENTKFFYSQKAKVLNQQNRASTQNELSAQTNIT